MKRKRPDVLAMLQKQTDKNAAAMLNTIDSMLRRGKDRASIEKVVARRLCTYVTEQMKILMHNKIGVPAQ